MGSLQVLWVAAKASFHVWSLMPLTSALMPDVFNGMLYCAGFGARCVPVDKVAMFSVNKRFIMDLL